MKKNIILLLGICSALLFSSCVDRLAVGDAFLEKSPGVDVNIDSVFSNAEYTRNFLWSAYGQIYCTYTSGNMMNGAPIDVLSDSYHCFVSWGGPIQSYYPGSLTENAQDTNDGNLMGKFSYSTKGLGDPAGGRVSIYETVRKCWQIIENIDRVPNMSDDEKSRLRGEAYTIMASRYFDAFRNFGGICLAKKAYAVGEAFTDGRATALETFHYIDTLCQKAIAEPGFIWNIDNADIAQWSGRLTRASARALRAKVWLFAASPLFNNTQAYRQYDPLKSEGTNIEHVWFGKKDDSLWEGCLQRCDEFFQDNAANGNYYALIQPTSQDEAGYRMAFRRAYRYRNDATHHEKIFDAHPTTTLSGGGWGWGWNGFALDCYRQGGAVPTNELVECFGMSDGRNFPYADIYGAGKNPGGVDIFADRDPRLYETVLVPRQSLPEGFYYQGAQYLDSWEGGLMKYNTSFNNSDNIATGYDKFKWMLDYVGSDSGKIDDEYVGVPYIRMAEMYLIRAEALAELDRIDEAIAQVDIVRARVGLGGLKVKNPQLNLSDKNVLIDEILRERNCEIGAECGDRLYDMVRRMRQDIFTKPLHGIKIYRLDENGQRMGGDTDTKWDPSTPWPKFEYEKPEITVGHRRWWDPNGWDNKWYLDPVSRVEVQKGYGLTQNPGW